MKSSDRLFRIELEPHPLLASEAFTTTFPAPVSTLGTPAEIRRLLETTAPAPDEELRVMVRDLLRHGGYKPTGRGKPASEYLQRASNEGTLGSINLPVDACNAASLHSGFPISVIDLAKTESPFRIGVAPAGSSYVFNTGGQEIDLGGLLCLFDAEGPCANAVKDSQRTKTGPETVRTLSIVWGVIGHEPRLREAALDYRRLLENAGAATETVELSSLSSEQMK